MPAWLVFLLSGTVIVLAGVRLSRDGETIAERTGLGGAWIGAILVAGATSLPEVTSDLYAVAQGTPALAVGDLFGSSMINMLILAIADLSVRRVRVLTRVAINQALVGALAITLTAIAAAGVLTGPGVTLLGVGWAPLAIGFSYVVGMRVLHQNRGEPPFLTATEAEELARTAPSLRRAAVGFALAALVILVVARYLVSSTAELAGQLGISTGLAGVLLLALATSLPELVVSLASVRAGAYDLAVGNLLGSNCFNMVVLLVLDLADGPGSLLAGAGPSLAVGALFAIVLMGQVLLEVLNRAEGRLWYLEPNALVLAATYGVGLVLVYQAEG